MKEGWSVKKMQRLIVLSQTYQQDSHEDAADKAADPENRLLSHQNRRKLEFEPLRDALLSVSGRLDPRMGGKGDDIAMGHAPFSHRRSIYGFIDRQNLPGVFRTFDFASPDATVGLRHTTTTPPQALFLMNAPFVVEQARALASRPDVSTWRPTHSALTGCTGWRTAGRRRRTRLLWASTLSKKRPRRRRRRIGCRLGSSTLRYCCWEMSSLSWTKGDGHDGEDEWSGSP